MSQIDDLIDEVMTSKESFYNQDILPSIETVEYIESLKKLAAFIAPTQFKELVKDAL